MDFGLIEIVAAGIAAIGSYLSERLAIVLEHGDQALRVGRILPASMTTSWIRPLCPLLRLCPYRMSREHLMIDDVGMFLE